MLKDGKAVKAAYLAGPMRSVPGFNYIAFMAGAAALRAKGWRVFNPAEMDIAEDGLTAEFLDLSLEAQAAHAARYLNARRYARRDTRVLIDILRAEDGDAIITLPGWQDSIGARAEVAVADWVGLTHLMLAEVLGS